MEQHIPLNQLRVNDEVQGFYLLKSAYAKTNKNGKPFLSAVLEDASGYMDAKLWEYDNSTVSEQDAGRIVYVTGTVTEFMGALQLRINALRLRRPEEAVDLTALTPSAPIDADAVLARVWQLVESMEDDDYRAIATMMLQRREQDFRSIPAAKSVHHGFVGGLLMHTANMLEQADFLSRLYGPTINRSLLLAGTLLHDFGKMKEFSFSELGLVTEYSTEGQLLGHLVIGAEWVAAAARKLGIPEEKSLLLRHLILSHHGEPEFGAAVVPVCMESELLHLIDKIDSRVEIYRKASEEVPVGAFSSRIFALEHRVYHHP